MELKSVMVNGKTDGERGSNRTFMELKCERLLLESGLRRVLIAPLWN